MKTTTLDLDIVASPRWTTIHEECNQGRVAASTLEWRGAQPKQNLQQDCEAVTSIQDHRLSRET